MKRTIALASTFGILFFAGKGNTFQQFDAILYPAFIIAIIATNLTLLQEKKSAEKTGILINCTVIALYLSLWTYRKVAA
jgi:hypothetical protein